MEENKDKLVFSSIRSEKKLEETTPKEVVDKAFHDEYIRQTQEIPVEQIKQALEQEEKKEQQLRLINPERQVQQVNNNQPKTVQQVTQVNQQTTIPNKPVQQPQVQQAKPKIVEKEPSKKEINTIKPEKKERHRMKREVKIAIIVLIVISTTIFSSFRIISYFKNPRVITKKFIVNTLNEAKSILRPTEQATLIGDDYNISSTMTTTLDSQVFKEDALTDVKMLENLYLMNNLNSSKTTVSVIHNSKDKKFFFNRQTVKNDRVIINDKYLIDNSTEYYYVQDYLVNYINDGNNTYFETIGNDVNALDNIDYLTKFIINNLPNCIDDELFNQTQTTTYINNKTENVRKLSIELTNKEIRKIANNVLSKLKKDKESFNILNGVIDDFANYKITSKTKFIESNEKLTINLYTQGSLNRAKKYEIIKSDSKTSKAITYELEDKKVTYLENNKVKYNIKYKINSTSVKGDITNKLNKKIGRISFDNTENRKHFTLELEDEKYNTSIDINYKISDKKTNSYKSTTKAIINIKKENRNYLSGTINVSTKTTNKVAINEEVKDLTFSSEITEEKEEELKNLFKTRLKKAIN